MPRKAEAAVNTDARILRSREALRAALLKLLKKTPFEEISIRDIVAEAGIGYTTFFRHHPTKESLLNEIASDEIHRLVSITFPILEIEDSRASCRALCAYVDKNRPLWTALLAGGAAAALREAFIAESWRVTQSRPSLRSGLPAELGNVLVSSSVLEVLRWWLQQKKPAPLARVAEILDQMVVTPTLSMK